MTLSSLPEAVSSENLRKKKSFSSCRDLESQFWPITILFFVARRAKTHKTNNGLRKRFTVRTNYPLLILFIAIFSHLTILPIPALSQTPFYQGKTLKIINNDPGGTAGMRVKAVIPYLRKYIP